MKMLKVALIGIALAPCFGQVGLRRLAGAPSSKDIGALKLSKPKRCGDYFFVYPGIDQHGPILFYVTRETDDDAAIGMLSERDEFRVHLAEQPVPTILIRLDKTGIEGHVIILRMGRDDYAKAKDCLPRPESY